MNNKPVKHIDKFWKRYVLALLFLAALGGAFAAVFAKTGLFRRNVDIEATLGLYKKVEFREEPGVYADALALGWEDWSWDARVNFSSYDFAQGRGSSIKIEYGKPFGGFMIRAPHFNTLPYKSLQVAVYNAGEKSKSDIFIELVGPDNSVLGSQRLSWYAEDKIFKPGRWYGLSVPLQNLNASGKEISSISLVSGSLGTVYLDEIKFSDKEAKSEKWTQEAEDVLAEAKSPKTEEVEPEIAVAYQGFAFPYASDFFNRKNDWEASGGTIQIAGGKMRLETSSSTSYSIFVLKGSKFWINYVYTVFLDWAKGDSINLVARYSPEDGSYFSCSFFDDGANVTLYQARDGKAIELDHAPNFTPARVYDWLATESLGIRADGGEVSCLANGQVLLKAKAKYPMPVAGSAALEMWNPASSSGAAIIDKVVVQGL